MVLALLKIGFDLTDILSMRDAEAVAWLENYNQLMNPKPTTRTYVVQKKKGKG